MPTDERSFDDLFTNVILNICAGKTFAERMRLIAAVLASFGNMEAAGDNPRGARVLFEASRAVDELAADDHLR